MSMNGETNVIIHGRSRSSLLVLPCLRGLLDVD